MSELVSDPCELKEKEVPAQYRWAEPDVECILKGYPNDRLKIISDPWQNYGCWVITCESMDGDYLVSTIDIELLDLPMDTKIAAVLRNYSRTVELAVRVFDGDSIDCLSGDQITELTTIVTFMHEIASGRAHVSGVCDEN